MFLVRLDHLFTQWGGGDLPVVVLACVALVNRFHMRREVLLVAKEKGRTSVVTWSAGVLVEESPNAAPVQGLIRALRRCEYEVQTTRDSGVLQTVESGGPVLRVTPHDNDDACGYQGTHAAYSLTWAIPMLCQFQQRLDGLLPQEITQMGRVCAHCQKSIRGGDQAVLNPGCVHLAWWDLTVAQTLRAEPTPPEDLLRASALAKQDAKIPMPEPYKWVELAERVYFWEEAHPAPNLPRKRHWPWLEYDATCCKTDLAMLTKMFGA